MSKLKWFFLFAAAVLLAGCTFDPEPAEIDFGKVYVGQAASSTAHYRNNHNSKRADVGVYSVNAPFSVAGSNEIVAPGQRSSIVTATFAPIAEGKFEEEVRPGLVNAMEITASPLKLKGEGLFARNEGGLALENIPFSSVGSFSFGSAPIAPGQAVDWGTRKLGDAPSEVEFFVRNLGAAPVNGTAVAALLKGDRHFSITFPAAHVGFNISGAGGTQTREIRVAFDPSAVGEWTDVIEVTDTANPAARAGIVLKARVTETGE